MARGVRVNIELLKGAITGRGVKVAEALGIHSHSLYRKLKRDDPTLNFQDLNKICAFLGRDAADFLEFFPLPDKEQT
jgi:DNA-binding Xre family transcriptional regulator